MNTETIDLKEAALFLKMHPDTLRKKAAKGKIPGAKVSKQWCFFKEHLEQYLRSLYSEEAKASWGDHRRNNQWHSAKETKYGGFASLTKEREYKDLVGLRTNKRQKDFTTK